MADLMRAKDILDAIKRNKERVAPAEEDSGVITGYRMAHDHITEIIQRCTPTVDAVEVVHGKWEFIGDNMFECNNCCTPYTKDQLSSWKRFKNDSDFPNFCPACGAKMRGDLSNEP